MGKTVRSKTKTNAGRLKAGNKQIGYSFYKKRGRGYVTFPTKTAARKKGYNPDKIAY